MADERLTHLEGRFAWLERHVVEQDRAMAGMADEIRRLKLEIEALRERLRAAGAPGEGPGTPEPPPPHY